MTGPEPTDGHPPMPPVIWKMIISSACGGAVYLVSALTHQILEWSVLLSTFTGGIILVAQFLVDFDRNLQRIEGELSSHKTEMGDIIRETFLKINSATSIYSAIEGSAAGEQVKLLINSAAELKHFLPDIVLRLARSEIDQAALLLRGLGEGHANYVGEDQDWLLALTRVTAKTIDAISTTAVDGGGGDFAGSFWTAGLGQRYLGAQRDATNRGVTVRRLFILNSESSLKDDAEFQRICRMQSEAHVDIRILYPNNIPDILRVGSTFDFILFDGAVSYETNPGVRLDLTAKPNIANTLLITRQPHVQGRRILFDELWGYGQALS